MYFGKEKETRSENRGEETRRGFWRWTASRDRVSDLLNSQWACFLLPFE